MTPAPLPPGLFPPGTGEPDFSTVAHALLRRIDGLCRHTERPGTVTRTFLSPAARELHAELSVWAGEMGLDAWLDPAGNWHARLPTAADGPDSRPTFYLGSHLDTVPDGGRYDGLLGVVLALALAGALGEAGIPLPFGLEVLGFSEEEGVRFGVPFIGSLSALGEAGELLDLTDPDGVTVAQAMRDFGLNPARLSEAALPDGGLGYLEFHIEQGPVLEAAGQPLGGVSALVGQQRLDLTLSGRAGHAGTTPMELRHDALTAAAEWVLEVERLARSEPALAATVGQLRAFPGASNVIPGRVELTLDLRHPDDRVREEQLSGLLANLERICGRRGVRATWEERSQVGAVPLDPGLLQELREAARQVGLELPTLLSGAGHDAMILARRMPAAMLFLRTPGGVSHDPAEAVEGADVAAALRVGWHFLLGLAARPLPRPSPEAS